MAFSTLFKKKNEDDFSDFGTKETPMAQPAHMGLPLDGDMTNLGQQHQDQAFDPAPSPYSPQSSPSFSESPHSPEAFSKLNQMTRETSSPLPSTTDHSNSILSKVTYLEKDMEIINAKMDSIKSLLESLNQRLIHIERIAEDSKPKEETIRW
jgi:hypothetical protein